VGHGHGVVALTDDHRLGVADLAGASGGIAVVADGYGAGEPAERFLIEYLRHQPHTGKDADAVTVAGGDAGALLAAVLESKQGKKSKPGYIFLGTIDAENATSLVQTARLFVNTVWSESDHCYYT
jgi:hypothetical protein